MAKTKTVREFSVADIEREFELVPLQLGPLSPPHPAVAKRRGGGYSIRVLVSVSGRRGHITEKYDYFYLAEDGEITTAPWGHAKDYRPGRIPVAELDAAAAKYATP